MAEVGIAAVVVSFNTREMTLRCLRALLDQSPPLDEIWLVDNASVDGSVEAAKALDQKIRVIALPENTGFGAANNLAMRASDAAFFALVNSDAFAEPEALALLREHLESHPEVGMVGPDLRNPDGSPQHSRFPFPSPRRAWLENTGLDRLGRWLRSQVDSQREEPWDWLGGACLMLPRRVFEQTGGFDESFFLYAEETDWQRRIRAAGWGVDWVGSARVTHWGGASGGQLSEFAREHFFRGVDRYFWKHHGRMGWLQLRMAMGLGIGLRWMRAGLGVSTDQTWPDWRWLLRRQLTAPPPSSGS